MMVKAGQEDEIIYIMTRRGETKENNYQPGLSWRKSCKCMTFLSEGQGMLFWIIQVSDLTDAHLKTLMMSQNFLVKIKALVNSD